MKISLIRVIRVPKYLWVHGRPMAGFIVLV